MLFENLNFCWQHFHLVFFLVFAAHCSKCQCVHCRDYCLNPTNKFLNHIWPHTSSHTNILSMKYLSHSKHVYTIMVYSNMLIFPIQLTNKKLVSKLRCIGGVPLHLTICISFVAVFQKSCWMTKKIIYRKKK